MRTPRVLTLALAAAAIPAAGAAAAPPPNDSPAAASAFQPFTAADGRPRDLQATADLAQATPDPGVPRCLGGGSFQRTAWYLVPGAPTQQAVTVEGMGRTLAVADLAAFVQPEGATGPLTRQPNVCDGVGAGGSDAAEEPTSAVTLHVPARRSVLIQAGRRGAPGTPEDESMLLSLDAQPLTGTSPPGDIADRTTPRASTRRGTIVNLGGATISEDDPAQPSCPSLGTVWRRVPIRKSGRRLITVRGHWASTLAAYSGRSPTSANGLDCVNRSSYGALQLDVPVRRRKALWISLGADGAPSGARAKIRVEKGSHAVVVDGGPGGFDPTTGGPGGGLPTSCERSRPERARVRGPRIAGSVAARNRRPVVSLRVAVRRSAVCDVLLELAGPHKRVYARGRAIRLKGRRVVQLRRLRHLPRGRYRLRVSAISRVGDRVSVRTKVRGRLR